MRNFIGGDLGGTNIRAAIVSEDGTIKCMKKSESHPERGAEAVMETMISLIESLDGYEECEGIGMGIPGPIDTINGKIIVSTNLPKLIGFPIAEYIENHFRENISSKELSRRFGYDEAYFCRRFKSVTGLSPMIYIQILRLEYARRAIKNEKGVKISEISSSCGFSDPGYFARCFKKHYGMTPTEYSTLLQI